MKNSKKALSLLLAVMIIVTSISVCFGTITFAVPSEATDAEYKALADALMANGENKSIFTEDSVKIVTNPEPASSGGDNASEMTDYKGYYFNAAAAWWTLFKKVWDPYSTDNMNYRLTSQINSAILTKLEGFLDVDTYEVSRFINLMVANITPDASVNGWLGSSPKGVTGTCKITLDVTEYLKQFNNISDIPASILTYAEYKVDNASGQSTGSGTKKKKFNAIKEESMLYTPTINTDIKTTLLGSQKALSETYAEYFTLAEGNDLPGLAAKGETALNNAKTAIAKVKSDITGNGAYNGEQIWKYFFATDYDAKILDVLGDAEENITGDIDKALEILSYDTTAANIEASLKTNLGSIANNIDALSALHGNLLAYQKTINEATYKTEIIDYFDLDMEKLQEFIDEVKEDWDLAVIASYKTDAEGYIAAYKDWTKEDVLDGTISTADLINAYTNINFVYQQIANCDQSLVAQVCGDEFFGKLDAVNSNIEVLMQASDSWDKFMPAYEEFKSTIKELTVTTLDTYVLLENLKNHDNWYEELRGFIEKIEEGFGKEIAQQLMQDYDDEITKHMKEAYEALYAVVEPQIQAAYDVFHSYIEIYGDKVSMASYEDFLGIHDELQASLGLIDKNIFDFLSTTNNGGLSEEGAALYSQIENALSSFERFDTNKGLDAFHTSTVETEREDTNEDIARENEDNDKDGIGEYIVTDENVEKVIDLLEAALKNEKAAALLGDLINKDEDDNPTGESFSIAALVEGLLNDSVYTDSLINTIIQYVYPLVCKEFAKVWAGLPATIEIPGVDTGIAGLKANVEAGLSLYDVENAIAAVGVYLAPTTLAKNLRNDYNANSGQYAKYTQVIGVLESATTKAIYDKGKDKESDADDTFQNPWDDSNLFEVVVDENNNIVYNDDGTPKQVYKLKWGVDEAENKREAFVDAACAALSGLEPLLFAILTNHNQANAEDTDGTPRGHKIGTGSGSAKVQNTITSWPKELDLKLTIDPITLVLKFQGNDGWDNALAPIFEALGLKNIPHSEELTTTRKILEDGLLAMIDQIIEKLEEAPVTFILEALPNICYALEAGFVGSLLGMLKTDITYYADAAYSVNAYLTTVEGKMDEAMASKKELENGEKVWDPIKINLGDMINLADMGIDLNSGIMGLLASFIKDVSLPAINGVALATMGELEWHKTNRSEFTYNYHPNDRAAYIVANRADVLEYVIKYALGNLNTLLGAFNVDTTTMGELVDAILTNVSVDSDASLAGIVELLNQTKYETLENYKWYNGSYESDEELNFAPDTEIYMNPGNDWTEDKAEYLYENIETLLDSVLTMAGVDFDLTDSINGIFTNETLTAVAKLLGMLDLDELLSDSEAQENDEPATVEEGEETETAEEASLNELVKELLGIDLSSYAQYADLGENEIIDFGVTDAASFAAALVELLAPIKSVLDFILVGGDLEITLSETDKITLIGYDGYDSAIVPLLEALGCNVKALSEDDDALEAILDTVVAKVNTLTIKGIIDMLPGVVYFLASGGLTTAVRNLLQPVYVILDTIRPIYDVDLDALVADIEIGTGDDAKALGINLSALNVGAIVDLVENLTGLNLAELKALIYDVAKCVGTEYKSVSTLQSNWKKGAYTADFDQADMLTVLLSFLLEWASVRDNAEALDEMLGTDGIIAALNSVFASVEISYGTPDWMYWFSTEEEFNSYVNGETKLPNTLEALEYPNDWSFITAEYIAENFGDLVDEAIALINKDKEDAPETVKELLGDLLEGYMTADVIEDLVASIAELLGGIDDNLLTVAGRLLDVDVAGLKSYTYEAEITDIQSFAAELANVLTTYADGLMNWLLFGDDFRFANKSDSSDTIVINGGYGYEKGLALVLEALGCDVPAADKATVANILAAVAARIEVILESPVDEILALIPNIIYFLNADAATVAVNNLLAPVYALLEKLEAFSIEVNLNELLGFDLKYLSLEDILNLAEEKTGFNLKVVEDMLVDFCLGKISKGTYIYKMTADKADTITVLLTTALLLVEDKDNAKALDELIGTDIISILEKVFEDVEITYTVPGWDYALADNGTVDAMKYTITYPNNWTKETAEYVAEVLPEIGDMVANIVDSNYSSLSDLLNDKVNVFTTETLESLIATITDLLSGISDGLVDAADVILNVNITGLKEYEVKKNITTAKEFAKELSYILSEYASGVVEWALLGKDYRFFVKTFDEETGDHIDFITLNGAHGYAEGLALLLEAIGCENLPDVYGDDKLTTKEIITDILESLAARIEEIFENPVEEVLELLPNLLYFLNTNGVAAVVDNTVSAVTALLDKLSLFGIDIDIESLIDIKSLMGLEDTDANISLDNLSMKDILEAVSLMVGIDLTLVENVLVGFALGQVNEYDSVSKQVGTPKKMTYIDEFDKQDLVTVLANLVILTLSDANNAGFVKELVGEEIYKMIIALFDIEEIPVQDFSWIETDKADTGYIFSAMDTTTEFKGFTYGEFYTEKQAQYIADNFGEFVDNIIYLVGIEMNGKTVNDLTELLNAFVNGSLYNSTNVVAIQDALAGVLANIGTLEIKGANVGKHIVEVLRTSVGVDINSVADVEVPEFTDDREQFVTYLCNVLEPLYPILEFVLAGRNISFFVNEDKTDAITLKGAKGYAYGIIPLLEVLECKGILTPDEYSDVTGDELLTSILTPLLNRVDDIMDAPADTILEMLPNIIYFINSNGLDTVIKNTLNAVYAVLAAIEPIAKIDLYEIVGIDFAEIDFDWITDKLLTMLEDMGYKFTEEDIKPIAELTVGELKSYTSLNGNKAYKMVYAGDKNGKGNKAEMVTVIERLAITFLVAPENQDALIELLKNEMGVSEENAEYLRGVIKVLADSVDGTSVGMQLALSTIYYVFYGLDEGVSGTTGGIKDLNAAWKDAIEALKKSNPKAAESLEKFLGWEIFEDIIDVEEGVAPNGFIRFFQRIADWFKGIGEWFKNLFSFSK